MITKKVKLFWRREELRFPLKQTKHGRLWFNDRSNARLKDIRSNYVWLCEFVLNESNDGKAFSTLDILNEYTRGCLENGVDRKLNLENVVNALTDHFITRRIPRKYQARR